MKKTILMLMLGLAAAGLIAGCSKKTAKEAGGQESGAAESQAAETVDLTGLDNGTVTLGEYIGVTVTKASTEVSPEEWEEAVLQDFSSYTDYAEVDRAVQDGDMVNIDYAGLLDGVAFEGGTAQSYDLSIGSGSFIEGFETGLIGAKKGEKVSLNLTFPEDYQSTELAGKAVVFEVTVNAVKEQKTPELNDEFVKEQGEFSTVEEYKDSILQGLLAEKNSSAENQLMSDIYDVVLKGCTVELNQETVEANYTDILANYTNQATAYGMDLTSFAAMFGMDENGFKEALKSQASSVVEQRLIVNAIAQKEGIQITDEDRTALAAEMGYESAETMIEQAGKFSVDDYVMNQKVMEFLISKAVIQ